MRLIDWRRDKEYSDHWNGFDRKTGIRVWEIEQRYGRQPFHLLWTWNCRGPYVGSYYTLGLAQAAACNGNYRRQVGVAYWKHVDEYGSKSVEEFAKELKESRGESLVKGREDFAKYFAMATQRKKEERNRIHGN